MKFSDLDKQLVTEAEAFDKKQGKLSRAGTKLKKKLGPTKGMRQKAAAKDELHTQAKDIKKQYYEFIGRLDLDPSVGSFKKFIDQQYEKLSAFVEPTATKLNYPVDKEPEKGPEKGSEDIQKQVPTDGINYSVELDKTGAPKKDAKPEKLSPEEEKAARDKIAADAEAEAKELGSEEADESVEEDAEDAEPKVDMSASIYESRLRYFLILNEKLKDNQIDTLIVRTIQAAEADGVGIDTSSSSSKEPEAKGEPEEKTKKGSLLKKAGKAYRKGMDKANKVAFGDLVSDGDEEYSGGSGGSEIDSLTGREKGALKSILSKVLDGKSLEKDDIKVAKKIVREL